MDKGKSSRFPNDGSFMEKFKQQEREKESSKPVISKFSFGTKASNDSRKTTPVSSSGKLAFSLKQKSKLVAPIKLSEDDENEEAEDLLTKRQKLGRPDASDKLSRAVDVAPPPPSDSTVKDIADRLANFVAKDEKIEHTARQKNPGDTPFKFLFDDTCADYKYYQYRLSEEKKALSQAYDSQASKTSGKRVANSDPSSGSQGSAQRHVHYQTPASALYDSAEDTRAPVEATRPASNDPVAMMEFYMKKAAQEERRRQPRQSKDEMPPPPSLQVGPKKGHHMGDFIPQEELDKFLATCGDAAARKAAKEAMERARIQADNVGHKLLSKMGWREGEGLGSSRSGMADPITAGDIKKDNLGVGANNPGEVTPDDDIYEQYKKRMMLGYRHRPNPLGNPRKSYY